MLLHELDGLLIFDQAFMGEEGGSVPRDIHLCDKHAGYQLLDRDTFYCHKSSDSQSERSLVGRGDRGKIPRALSAGQASNLIVVPPSSRMVIGVKSLLEAERAGAQD
jgi:hypothetical protein